MKKIWRYLVQHIQADFHLLHYLFIALFLAVAISINYVFDFEDTVLGRLTGIYKFLGYVTFYSTAYFTTLTSAWFFKRTKNNYFSTPAFWIRSILAIAVLSLDSSLPFLSPWINQTFHPALQYWMYKILVNLISFFSIMVPLLIFYWFTDRPSKHYYGLHTGHFDLKPYLQLLLIMLPLVIIASFESGFIKQYPMYKTSSAHQYLAVPEWVTVALYELAYGLDFITVEFLFRGFMIIGMLTVLGRDAVLAMAVTYCFLHFGKPAGEAISSIFGGYILGVVAYETRSIWGGVLVHVGLAWMMELVAYVQAWIRITY